MTRDVYCDLTEQLDVTSVSHDDQLNDTDDAVVRRTLQPLVVINRSMSSEDMASE